MVLAKIFIENGTDSNYSQLCIHEQSARVSYLMLPLGVAKAKRVEILHAGAVGNLLIMTS